ncbi:MAG: YHS domain-containing protein [Planctomycetota bacterium]|jgi:YHS domain-containing protein
MKSILKLACAALALTIGISAISVPQDGGDAKAKAAEAAMIAEQLITYPDQLCAMSGKAVDSKGTATNVLHEGRLYRFCCTHCSESFEADPDPEIIARVDAAIVKAQSANYPLKTCPISGKAFEKDDEPTNVFYGTRLVQLCCGRCAKSFAKDPSKTIAALDAAYIAQQLPTYKGKTCPVSGEALGSMGDPINVLYGNTLVQLCCKGCVRSYKKNPAKFMAKKAEHGEHGEHGKGGDHK